jgi:hypothetical protein
METPMQLIEEKVTTDGSRRAKIYMRDDGMFEARVYSSHGFPEPDGGQGSDPASRERYEVCALTETLMPARVILDEELGF